MPETKIDNETLANAANDALHTFMEATDYPYPIDGGDIIALSHLFIGLFHRWPAKLSDWQEIEFPPISVKVNHAIFEAAAKTYLDGLKPVE